MAGSFSDVTEDAILDLYFNGGTITNDTSLFLALYTVAPTDAGGGTEVAGGSYARLQVNAGAGGDFNASSGGVVTNAVDLTFATATANWGTIVALGIFTELAAGTFLMWGDLLVNKAVTTSDVVKILTGNLSITLD
jgi:hypothetical protein